MDQVKRIGIKDIDGFYDDLGLVLTVDEVARKLKVSKSTVRYWCETGYLIAEQRGIQKTWLISRRFLEHKTGRKLPV